MLLHVTRAHKLRLPFNTHKGTEYISTQWPESLPEYIYFVRSKINYNTKYTSSLTLCWNLNIINCQKFNITIYQNNSCLTNQNIDLTDGYITQLFVQGLDIFLNIWQLAVLPTVISFTEQKQFGLWYISLSLASLRPPAISHQLLHRTKQLLSRTSR